MRILFTLLLTLLPGLCWALTIELIDPWAVDTQAITRNQYPSSSHIQQRVLAQQQSEAVIIALSNTGADNSLPADLTLSTNCKQSISLNPYHIKAWYQADGAAKSIFKLSQKRQLVSELLVKNNDLLRIDHNHKKNYIYNSISQSYIDIESIKADKNGNIDLKHYRFSDSSKLSPFVIRPAHSIWLDISLNKPTTKDCRLSISIKRLDTVYTANLALKPLNYALPESKLDYPIYYRGRLPAKPTHVISSDIKSVEQLLADYKLLKAHGFSNPSLYQTLRSPSHSRAVFNARQQAGFNNQTIFHLGNNSKYLNSQYRQLNYQRKTQALAAQYNINDWFVYAIDEADDEQWQQQQQTWLRLQQQGIKILAAGKKQDKLSPVIPDTYVASYEPDPEQARLWQQQGRKIYAYAYPQGGVEDHQLYRHNYGLALWRAGYDGAMLYTYQGRSGVNIWDDFDGIDSRYRDHVMAYPSSNSAIVTLALKGFRQAVSDSRYLTLLQSCINNKPLFASTIKQLSNTPNISLALQNMVEKHCEAARVN